MAQLAALVWLKWALFRNSMRSRKAAVGQAASALGLAAALLLSLGAAAGLGVASHFLASPEGAGEDGALAARDAFVFLFSLYTMAFVMWALVPLAMGGGSRFEPGRMLLYPVSLGKLFAFDLLSDLTSLSAVFAVPAMLAMALGAGLATGSTPSALLVGACAVWFGMSLSKLLSAGVGAMMRRGRSRGETVLALLGALLGMAGALMGQLMPLMGRYVHYLERARWTPPGAVASALTRGLAPGGAADLALALATLAAYAAVCALLAYRLARRAALGLGGSAKRTAAAAREEARARAYTGWRLPLASDELSAVFEKEMRYAVRNAQLRVMALMAVGLTIVIRVVPFGGRSGRGALELTPYAEGAGTVFSVLYIFTLVSPLTTNLFGYEAGGMRAFVLAPVGRRLLLVGKNMALTLVSLALVAAGVVAGGVVFRDMTAGTLLFVVLTCAICAPLFALFGNWLSTHFPKRAEFGKRMNRSGLAGFLLLPFFVAMLVPPAAAVVAGHFAQSHAVKYVILAAFAIISVASYLLTLPAQARSLERRELEILEAVTGRGGEGDTRIMG